CLAQAPGLGGRAQILDRAHAERAPDRDQPLRPDAEEAAQRYELWLDLALELLELGQPAGRDELFQPSLDPRTDPAQLAYAPDPHELTNRRARLAHQFGRPPVRAHRVVP